MISLALLAKAMKNENKSQHNLSSSPFCIKISIETIFIPVSYNNTHYIYVNCYSLKQNAITFLNSQLWLFCKANSPKCLIHQERINIVENPGSSFPPQRISKMCFESFDACFRRLARTMRCMGIFNPILHSWFRESCFTFDGSSTIQVFPLLFNIGMVI